MINKPKSSSLANLQNFQKDVEKASKLKKSDSTLSAKQQLNYSLPSELKSKFLANEKSTPIMFMKYSG